MSDSDRVISVDQALEESTPKIEFRGELYEIADYTMAEKLRLTRKFKARQERIEEQTEALQDQEGDDEVMDDALDDLQTLMADALKLALKDMPDEVAETVTEREFVAIQNAVEQVRGEPLSPVEKEVEAQGKD